MVRPRLLVLVTPHAYATALATAFRGGKDNRYDVVVPNVMAGEDVHEDEVFNVVVTTLPVARGRGTVVVSLPGTAAERVTVTVGDLSVEVPVSGSSFLEDVVALVERYALAARHDQPTSPMRVSDA